MSTAPKHRYTVEEYLAHEAKSERRHEYYDGEIFAMAGNTPDHIRIVGNLSRFLGQLFDDQPCEVFTTELKVRTKKNLFTYPDAAIVCDEPVFEAPKPFTLLNPLVLIEVLSDSTENYDRTDKFKHYKTIPSLGEYVLIHQDEPLVEVFTKNSDGNWPDKPRLALGLDTEVNLLAVPCKLRLADIYRKVKFPPPEDLRRGNPVFTD